jgi:hypothetical protein
MGEKLSVAVLEKNAKKHIHSCLSSIMRADEMIVLDEHSMDKNIKAQKASA